MLAIKQIKNLDLIIENKSKNQFNTISLKLIKKIKNGIRKVRVPQLRTREVQRPNRKHLP